jgi:hypothetical protein
VRIKSKRKKEKIVRKDRIINATDGSSGEKRTAGREIEL